MSVLGECLTIDLIVMKETEGWGWSVTVGPAVGTRHEVAMEIGYPTKASAKAELHEFLRDGLADELLAVAWIKIKSSKGVKGS